MTLKIDTPVVEPIEDFEVRDPDPETVLEFMANMEFRTLTNRLAAKFGVKAPEIAEITPEGPSDNSVDIETLTAPIDPSKYEIVRDAGVLQLWIDAAYARGWIAVDTETTGLK